MNAQALSLSMPLPQLPAMQAPNVMPAQIGTLVATNAPQQQTYPGLKRPPPPVGTTINGMTYMGGDPRSKDPSVWAPATGDTFLNSLPLDDNKKTIIKAIANYDLPPGSQRGGLGSPEVQQLLGFAKQYDPSFSASDYVNRQQVRQSFLKGDYSKSVTALSTAIDHARALGDAGTALDNGQYPAVNGIRNLWRQYVSGDPRPGNFNQIAQMEGGEVTKAITNGQGGETDRSQATQNYPENGSPAQQQQAIATTVGLLKSKLDELNATYQRGMGSQHNVMELLSPSARRSWSVLSQQYGATDPNGNSVQQPPPPNGTLPTPGSLPRLGRQTKIIRYQDLP